MRTEKKSELDSLFLRFSHGKGMGEVADEKEFVSDFGAFARPAKEIFIEGFSGIYLRDSSLKFLSLSLGIW
ncbi:hypothetical protein CH361_11725 [Leptospira brenneri]|nr:hypothetical protein CH361_11725 [Leptospira brenneri]